MQNILNNYNLKKYNTFNVNVRAKYFASFNSKKQLQQLLENQICQNENILILGGGSNILFTKNINGIVLHNNINGISIIKEGTKNIVVKVGAGVVWHDFVIWSVKKNLSGIENLALIPGSVGASPIQNIGAYGAEVKSTIEEVIGIEINSSKERRFTNTECEFNYRSSIFKNELKNKYIITEVIFKLSKKHLNITSYGDVKKELDNLKLPPNPKNISTAVINIRNIKLPHPKKLANSGSFFKNPIISTNTFNSIKKKFPNIISYKISEKKIKIAAGWLIENAGLKGHRVGDAGVHKNQALVIVNYDKATGKEILNLANNIRDKIKKIYGISIENEVNIL